MAAPGKGYCKDAKRPCAISKKAHGRKLCNQIITIEAAKYISSLKNREFGLGNLIILPACLSKLLFCYLKGIS